MNKQARKLCDLTSRHPALVGSWQILFWLPGNTVSLIPVWLVSSNFTLLKRLSLLILSKITSDAPPPSQQLALPDTHFLSCSLCGGM